MRDGALRMNDDEVRTALLHFDAELSQGLVAPQAPRALPSRPPIAVRAVPAKPLRALSQVRYKLGARPRLGALRRLGGIDYDGAVVRSLLTARRAVLGDGATRPPRFLIRVDEFPHYRVWQEPERFGTASFARFHEILARAGVSYLVAVSPRVSREPLSPAVTDSRPLEDAEIAELRLLAGDGVAFGLHGRDHHTRFASPRRRSELCGLTPAQTEEKITRALAELADHDVRPEVFVPPFNRFDASQLSLLGRHFEVVCGGPESIGQLGFQGTPQWRAGTVYLPAYHPFYGRAAGMLAAVHQMIDHGAGLWVPVVLHWEWEQRGGWADLERLAALIAPYACAWGDFLAAIRRRAGQASPSEAGAQSGTAVAEPGGGLVRAIGGLRGAGRGR
jgi:Uncharacterized protein conserved in bacteria (DUF2334)